MTYAIFRPFLSPGLLFVALIGAGCGDIASSSSGLRDCEKTACRQPELVTVEFSADNPPAVAALEFLVDFAADVGTFRLGEGSSIGCSVASGTRALLATNETQHPKLVGCENACRRLHVSLLFEGGLIDSGLMLSCWFAAGDRDLTSDDFRVTVLDASDENALAIEPPPKIYLSGID